MQALFTSGPLLTTKTLKEAALVDMSSRDPKFISIIHNIRASLLKLSCVEYQQYFSKKVEHMLLKQLFKLFSKEKLISINLNIEFRVLVVSNRTYGERQAKILQAMNTQFVKLSYDQNQKCIIEDIIKKLLI